MTRDFLSSRCSILWNILLPVWCLDLETFFVVNGQKKHKQLCIMIYVLQFLYMLQFSSKVSIPACRPVTISRILNVQVLVEKTI